MVSGVGGEPLTVVVDAANVIGARPNGWWRDRAAAAAALHRELTALAAGRLAGAEIIMVLEGAARAAMPRLVPQPTRTETGGMPGGPDTEGSSPGRAGGVRVVAAAGAGDDEIARLARALSGRRLVVTADRELRRRCRAAGAEVVGPAWLYALLCGAAPA